MPSAVIYIGIMLLVIVIWFLILKRPVYEGVALSFIVLVTVTGTWGQIGSFINTAFKTSLLYSMTAFVAMSIILTKTKIIDYCIAVILSLLGRVTGGAGYVSVIASAFMGALSGSGPGNVMATGAITIPAMKKSGFPAELAANIESNASCLGNLIPPSANIVAALGAFTAVYPESNLSQGQFWIVLWGVSFWFILQRLLMVFAFCKYYKVKPMKKEELPDLKQTLKEGWQGLLLPVIILLPFLLDYFFKDTLFTARLGADGAKLFSGSLLLFIGGVASLYAVCIAKQKPTPHKIATWFADSIKSIAPIISVCVFGYLIGALFSELKVAQELELFFADFNMPKIGIISVVCILVCFLGTVIPGSSLVVVFGSVLITTFTAHGINPVLAAAMLPCICSVMGNVTPPFGLCMYAGMCIAESDFSKTFKNNLIWVAAQFVLQIVVLMGWLPIMGL